MTNIEGPYNISTWRAMVLYNQALKYHKNDTELCNRIRPIYNELRKVSEDAA